MDSDSKQPPRVAFWLIGTLVVLGLVRLYYELIVRQAVKYDVWFAVHPRWIFVLMAFAILPASLAAWWVRRKVGRGLVIPFAVVAGALTTAIQSSLTGTAVGLCVGMLFTFDRLRGIVFGVTRFTICRAVPLLGIALVGGLLARMATYSERPDASAIVIAVYVLTGVFCLWIGMFGIWPIAFRRRAVGAKNAGGSENETCSTDTKPSNSPEPAKTRQVSSSRSRRSYRVGLRGLQLVLVAGCFVIGIWLGWQGDVQRRIRALDRVGSAGSWSRIGLRQKLLRGPVTVESVYLGRKAKDVHMKLLRGLPDITHVDVFGSRITDDSLRHLTCLKSLDSLSLSGTPTHDEGFRHIMGLRSLRTVHVQATELTRDAFSVLATLPSLNHARFSDLKGTGTGLEQLTLSRGLRWVQLDNCGITDDDLAGLAKSTFLSYLSLRDNKIEGPGLAHLAGHAKLATLDLSGNPLDDRYLESIAKLNINGLSIDGVRLSDRGCRAIQQMRWLQDVSLRRSRVTDRQFRQLRVSGVLQDATLDGSQLSPRAFIGWSQRDVTVYVEDEQLVAADIQRLADMDTDIVLEGCELDPSAVAEFLNHPRMFTLHNCNTQERFMDELQRYTRAY